MTKQQLQAKLDDRYIISGTCIENKIGELAEKCEKWGLICL